MKIIVTKDYEEMSAKAYEIMKSVATKGNVILGLATGSSPIGLYKNMIADCKAGNVSYKDIKTVNLDEYVGLDDKSDQSYVYFMNHNLFNYIDIDKKNTFLPNGMADDMYAESERYTNLLKGMQQDIQVLGLGSNGHIGFNEPGTSFDSTTHVVELKESTRRDNARFFQSLDEVPTHAITMGIANIMNAKKVLMIANGENKADAVKALVEGEMNENCPASALQKHADFVLVLDEKAASKLEKKY